MKYYLEQHKKWVVLAGFKVLFILCLIGTFVVGYTIGEGVFLTALIGLDNLLIGFLIKGGGGEF